MQRVSHEGNFLDGREFRIRFIQPISTIICGLACSIRRNVGHENAEMAGYLYRPMNKEQILRPNSSFRLPALVLLVPLLLAAGCQLLKVSQSLFFRGDNTFPESAVVQTAEWSRDTGRVYPALQQAPYTPAPYGPLFYLALSGLARSTHAGFDQLMIAGRILVFVCFLLLPLGIWHWGRKQGLPPIFALIGSAMVLAQIDFVDWNVSVRPDLPALLFSLAAFYLLTSFQLSYRGIMLAGALCGVAALFKQSFIALPFVVILWLASTRRWRDGLLFACGGAAVGIAVLGYLTFHHEPFLREILLARYSPVSVIAAVQLLKADVSHYPWQVVFVGLGVMGALFMPAKNGLRRFVILYLVFAWLSGFYVAMAPGANVNAFLEAWILTAALAAIAVYRIGKNWAAVPVPAQVALLVLWLAPTLGSMDAWRAVVSSRPSDIYRELAEIARGRHVLSDFPYVSAHGVQPELLDPSVNHYLELAGYWSPKRLLQEVHRQEFDLIFVGLSGGQPRQWRGLTLFSESILRQIAADYRLECMSDRFALYMPERPVVLDAASRARLQNLGCQIARAPAARADAVQ